MEVPRRVGAQTRSEVQTKQHHHPIPHLQACSYGQAFTDDGGAVSMCACHGLAGGTATRSISPSRCGQVLVRFATPASVRSPMRLSMASPNPCCSTVASLSHPTATSTCHCRGSLVYELIEVMHTVAALQLERLVGVLDGGAPARQEARRCCPAELAPAAVAACRSARSA